MKAMGPWWQQRRPREWNGRSKLFRGLWKVDSEGVFYVWTGKRWKQSRRLTRAAADTPTVRTDEVRVLGRELSPEEWEYIKRPLPFGDKQIPVVPVRMSEAPKERNYAEWLRAHFHCWHGTGRTYATMPPQWDEVCCHCGEVRRVTAGVEHRERHGPHMPKVAE